VHISSLKLKGFRCFGPTEALIPLEKLTGLVGDNGAGKSAALAALNRLFGITAQDRTLLRTDFHLAVDADWATAEEAALTIEARLEFPELENPAADPAPAAACFRHMTITAPGARPYAIIRLTGAWRRSNLPDGEIEQSLVWVVGNPGAAGEQTTPVAAHDRARIHVHYVPATRDPVRQIKQVSGSMLHSLLRAVEWSDEVKQTVVDSSEAIREAIGEAAGVRTITQVIETCWQQLHREQDLANVVIRPVANRIEDLIGQVEAAFSPTPGGREQGVDKLSDGQKSLFYLALTAMVFEMHRKLAEDNDHGLSDERLTPPVLTLIAVEEPENHISPYYLGRIITLLAKIAGEDSGQIILTSHSASILNRIEPEAIRHLRLNRETRETTVRRLPLPSAADERGKFIREAVRAHPEIYFARFVVLGEGASEEVILPRVAKALGVEIDPNFVAMVPLGGRHVNHFWKLLSALEIPFITVLDLDLEREGGGWGRIKYALEQLLETGVPEADVLAGITRAQLTEMHTWPANDANLGSWITHLAGRGVIFSAPLDLDFLMLRAFPTAYQALQPGELGPRIPPAGPAFTAAATVARTTVLSESATVPVTYGTVPPELFFWYRYLFLGRGKPATHTLALLRLTDAQLQASIPASLRDVVERIRAAVLPPAAEDLI
jgi:putative ATP-dependent endonuclease of OLD family